MRIRPLNNSRRTSGGPKRRRSATAGLALCLTAFAVWGQDTPTNEVRGKIVESQTLTNPAVSASEPRLLPQEGTTNEPAISVGLDAKAKIPATDFKRFQVIADRNIFNPNRTRRSRSGSGETEKPRPPKIDVISLSGTMIYAQGNYAFFDSSASAFRKAARPGDLIAGYTLREVQQTHVALARGSNSIQLKVGEQLRREGDGDWQVTSGVAFSPGADEAPGVAVSDSPVGSGVAPPDSSATTASGGSEGSGEALKRLLEKRRKEEAQ